MAQKNWIVAATLLVIVWTAGLRFTGLIGLSRSSAAPPPMWQLPEFAFVDQDNQPVTNESFKGRVWIADFFFTNCSGICPRMTAVMVGLQKRVVHPDIGLLSFSVDPDRDTPAKLKEYARSLGVDESRWRFATSNRRAMLDVAVALNLTDKPHATPDVVLHSDRVFLIDRKGQVRGVYDSNQPNQLDQLLKDAECLASSAQDNAVNVSTHPGALFTKVSTENGPSIEALAKDLVCGMDVQACEKTEHCDHDGRSFYFCSSGCRKRFESQPAKYVK